MSHDELIRFLQIFAVTLEIIWCANVWSGVRACGPAQRAGTRIPLSFGKITHLFLPNSEN